MAELPKENFGCSAFYFVKGEIMYSTHVGQEWKQLLVSTKKHLSGRKAQPEREGGTK